MKLKRSKIRKIIKQQRKGYLRNCVIALDIDTLPLNFTFDTKYWMEMLYQRGVMLVNSKPQCLKIIKFKPRKL